MEQASVNQMSSLASCGCSVETCGKSQLQKQRAASVDLDAVAAAGIFSNLLIRQLNGKKLPRIVLLESTLGRFSLVC